jgi:hypothetical protein
MAGPVPLHGSRRESAVAQRSLTTLGLLWEDTKLILRGIRLVLAASGL